MTNIFLKVACLCVSSLVYSMEPDEVFRHSINFKTYNEFEKLPLHLQQDILNQSASMWNNENLFFSEMLQKIIFVERKVPFTSDEMRRRYPWEMRDNWFFSKSVLYQGEQKKSLSVYSITDFALSLQESIYEIVGPNVHNRAILYGQVENLNLKIDAHKEGFFARLKKSFKQMYTMEPVVVPGQPLALHPYKNKCAFAHEFKGLYLYDLDTHEQTQLPGFEGLGVNENHPALAEFGTDDRLFVANRGSLFIYSLRDHKLIGTINGKKMINDGLFTHDFLDAQRREQTVVVHDERETCHYLAQIEDFDYSPEYANHVLCKVAISYYKEDKYGAVIAKSAFPLEQFRLHAFYYVIYDLDSGRGQMLNFTNNQKALQLMWDSSIEIYRLRNFSEWLGQRDIKRDTVSLISWSLGDVKSYILTAAAHAWLQGKQRNLNDAQSILSTLRRSDHRYKLLWQSTYRNEAGQRTNPFKDIFNAIKGSGHTNVTDVI